MYRYIICIIRETKHYKHSNFCQIICVCVCVCVCVYVCIYTSDVITINILNKFRASALKCTGVLNMGKCKETFEKEL